MAKEYDQPQAVAKVLLESGVPMHYVKVTEEALRQKLFQTKGKTPWHNVRSFFSREMQDGKVKIKMPNGEGITIHKHEDTGYYYAMPPSPKNQQAHSKGSTAIMSEIDKHKKHIKEMVKKRLAEMDPINEVEPLIVDLLAAMGFEEAEGTPGARDGGIDARGVLMVDDAIPFKIRVQVKRYTKNSIGPDPIRALRGVLKGDEIGVFVTTGLFTNPAREAALEEGDKTIALIDGDKLAGLLLRHGKVCEKYGLVVTEKPVSLYNIEEPKPSQNGGGVAS